MIVSLRSIRLIFTFCAEHEFQCVTEEIHCPFRSAKVCMMYAGVSNSSRVTSPHTALRVSVGFYEIGD